LYLQNKSTETLRRANKTLVWIFKRELIRKNHNVSNGLNLSTCNPFEDYRYTYNSGVLAVGLKYAGISLHNKSLETLAEEIINATLKYKTKDGVLVEDCAPDCNNDTISFKGIFM